MSGAFDFPVGVLPMPLLENKNDIFTIFLCGDGGYFLVDTGKLDTHIEAHYWYGYTVIA